MIDPTIDTFLLYLKNVKNSSVHTLRNYGSDLTAFAQFVEEKKLSSLEDVSRQTIRAFLAHLAKGDLSKRTIVRRFSALRSFFKWAIKVELITHNPTEELESPRIDKRIPHFLSYDQVCKLLEQPDIHTLLGFRDRAAMELLYSSGLRVSELIALNRSDLNQDTRLIKVAGKGKKERFVPATACAMKWINNYLNHPEREKKEVDSHALFLNKLGKRLTARSVDRFFTHYVKQSGLSGTITPHTLRHTIATHWLENGMDLMTIGAILGHKSPLTTTIYTQVSTHLKKQVYDKTHPRA